MIFVLKEDNQASNKDNPSTILTAGTGLPCRNKFPPLVVRPVTLDALGEKGLDGKIYWSNVDLPSRVTAEIWTISQSRDRDVVSRSKTQISASEKIFAETV